MDPPELIRGLLRQGMGSLGRMHVSLGSLGGVGSCSAMQLSRLCCLRCEGQSCGTGGGPGCTTLALLGRAHIGG